MPLWLVNFLRFSGYKHTIRLVSKLRKRMDQALILISYILMFSAHNLLDNSKRESNIKCMNKEDASKNA